MEWNGLQQIKTMGVYLELTHRTDEFKVRGRQFHVMSTCDSMFIEMLEFVKNNGLATSSLEYAKSACRW